MSPFATREGARGLLIAALLCAAAAPAGAVTLFYEITEAADRIEDPARKVVLYTKALEAWTSKDDGESRGLVHARRGYALLDLDRPEDALADMDRAVEFSPEDFTVHQARGQVLTRLRRCRDALSAYGTALRLAPAQVKGVLFLDRGLTSRDCSKDLPAALTDFETGIQASRKAADAESLAKNVLERGATRCLQREYKDALETLRLAVRLRPESPDVHSGLGVCLQRKGDWEGAAKSFSAAIRLGKGVPELGEWHHRRAQAYEELDESARAAADYRSGCRLGHKPACRRAKELEAQE